MTPAVRLKIDLKFKDFFISKEMMFFLYFLYFYAQTLNSSNVFVFSFELLFNLYHGDIKLPHFQKSFPLLVHFFDPLPPPPYNLEQKSVLHAGRKSMLALNQIEGISSERAYSVTG